MIGVDGPKLPDVATFEELWPKLAELREPIEAAYRGEVAAPQRVKKQRQADVEREYAQKLGLAKSDLARAQRAFKETTYALKRWRDASIAAAEQEYRNVQAVASVARKRAMEPVDRWFNEQRERLLKEQQAKTEG